MNNDNLKRTAYPTDLTDSQWAVIAPLFSGMREYKYSKRELLNAVLYLVDDGLASIAARRLGKRFTASFVVQKKVVCGIKFYNIWLK